MDLKDFLIEITLDWNKNHEQQIPMQFITYVLNQAKKEGY